MEVCVRMRVIGWDGGGLLWCQYVLGSSLEPGSHHYSPAADDTDPLSNLSPGADHGRMPLHSMLDWYSPHLAPHVLNLHRSAPPLPNCSLLLFLTSPGPLPHLLWCTGAKPPGKQGTLFLCQTFFIKINKAIQKWMHVGVQAFGVKKLLPLSLMSMKLIILL